MDISNRLPSISEDTLQYAIYPHPDAANRASATGLAAQMRELVSGYLPEHIWHRDAFELKVVPDLSSHSGRKLEGTIIGKAETMISEHTMWMLEGRMRVGDSVDDEWLVVWLLLKISAQWDVAISIFDSDGEFLLIEAADHLPSWVTPENAENRVWIYRSGFYLIPLSYTSPPSTRPKQRRKAGGQDSDGDECLAEEIEWLNVQDALSALRSGCNTEAPLEVQGAILNRITGYPRTSCQHLHVAKAYMPVGIVKALSQNPSLVQRAVEAFYTRDATQLRAAHRMARFPPQPAILSTFRITRTAYAQLCGQRFYPPKVFGPFEEKEGTKEWKWSDIGMKIACGFEMLYQESKSRSDGLSAEAQNLSADARKDALRRNPEYITYIRDLQSKGYFRGELEGSKLWRELENKSAEVFVETRSIDDASRATFAELVNNAIARAGDGLLVSNLEEESDEWLTVDAEGFDKTLLQKMRAKPDENYGDGKMNTDQKSEDMNEDATAAQATKLRDLAKKIENFVEGEGSLGGALFEDEGTSDEEDQEPSEFSEEEFPSESEKEKIQNTGTDAKKAEKAARQDAMDNLVPPLGPGEYGQMPASHYQSSQRTAPVTLKTEKREAIAIAKEGSSETMSEARPIRRPLFPPEEYEGAEPDDDSEEEIESEESEEERPQVVGDIEIDMEEEEEEFLEFSRAALGISDEMWESIIRDRKESGGTIPKSVQSKVKSRSKEEESTLLQAKALDTPHKPPKRRLESGPRPNINPNLDTFEAVMEAMEAELSKSRQESKRPTYGPPRHNPSFIQELKPGKVPSIERAAGGKGKDKALVRAAGDEEADSDEADLEAMDEELRAALDRNDGESGDDEPMDYTMIKNFLESFKSQAGLAGPVSALAGRLEKGWNLPRDESEQ